MDYKEALKKAGNPRREIEKAHHDFVREFKEHASGQSNTP